MILTNWLTHLNCPAARSTNSRRSTRARSASARSQSIAAEVLEQRLYLSAVADMDSSAHGFWYLPEDYTGPDPHHAEHGDHVDHGDPYCHCGHCALCGYTDHAEQLGSEVSSDFVASSYKWPQPNGLGSSVTVTYSYSNLFDGGLGGSLSEAQLKAAVEEALGLWSSVAPLHFIEVVDSGPAVSDTGYVAGGYPDIRLGHEYIDGGTGANVLAHAYYPTGSGLGGDVHYDEANIWRIGPELGTDFLEVTVHELGHSLGINHEPMPSSGGNNAIMNPYYGGRFLGGLGNGFLLPDDVAAIQSLYGIGTGSVTPISGSPSPGGDDHGNNSVNATVISGSNPLGGKIEVGGDEDWFAFDAAAGTSYSFETSPVTLADTTLTLYDRDGNTVLKFDDDSGRDLASKIDWSAGTTGRYFLKVNAFSTSLVGTYTLTVSEVATISDDHGNNSLTATPVSANSTVSGTIETSDDADWFSFEAGAGSSYTLETALGSLEDSTLTLFSTNGATSLGFDDDGGVGHGSRLVWTAPATGTYYARVKAFSGLQTGTYTLGVTRTATLGIPSPLSPGDTIQTTVPTFSWTAANGAAQYEVLVTDVTSNATALHRTGLTGTSLATPAPLANGHQFRWQVRAVSQSGIPGDWSQAKDFLVQAALVDAPTSTGIAGTTTDTTPTFQWSAVTGAARYDLWVNDQTTGQSGIIRQQNLTATSYTPFAELQTGHQYHWAVRAFDTDGVAGNWSQHLDFLVTTPVGIPTPSTPTQTTIGTEQYFSWTSTDGADHYDVWVNDLTTGQSGVIRNRNVAGTSYVDSSSLTLGHSYVWAVRAINSDEVPGEWSEAAQFTVVAPVATPRLLGPVGSMAGTVQRFEWSAVDNAVRYELWVNDLTTGQYAVIREQTAGVTSFETTELSPGHTYQWGVRAFDAASEASLWSNTNVFTVSSMIEPPALLGPSGDTRGATQTFEWTSVAGASRYDLWVNDLTTNQSAVIRNTQITSTTFTATTGLTAGHSYVWAVRSFDTNGAGGRWSDTRTFSITTSLEAPQLLAPIGNSTGASQTFEWSAVTGAARYDLWVNDLTTGQVGIVRNQNVQTTTLTTSALVAEHTYLWTVRAIDINSVVGEWGTHRSFTVHTAVGSPTPIAPTGTITNRTPTFMWSNVSGAANYELLVRDLTTGSNTVIEESNLTSTIYQSQVALEVGHTYRWWVRAFNSNGDAGSWSSNRSITMQSATNLIAGNFSSALTIGAPISGNTQSPGIQTLPVATLPIQHHSAVWYSAIDHNSTPIVGNSIRDNVYSPRLHTVGNSSTRYSSFDLHRDNSNTRDHLGRGVSVAPRAAFVVDALNSSLQMADTDDDRNPRVPAADATDEITVTSEREKLDRALIEEAFAGDEDNHAIMSELWIGTR